MLDRSSGFVPALFFQQFQNARFTIALDFREIIVFKTNSGLSWILLSNLLAQSWRWLFLEGMYTSQTATIMKLMTSLYVLLITLASFGRYASRWGKHASFTPGSFCFCLWMLLVFLDDFSGFPRKWNRKITSPKWNRIILRIQVIVKMAPQTPTPKTNISPDFL